MKINPIEVLDNLATFAFGASGAYVFSEVLRRGQLDMVLGMGFLILVLSFLGARMIFWYRMHIVSATFEKLFSPPPASPPSENCKEESK